MISAFKRRRGRSGLGLITIGLPLLLFAILSIQAPNFLGLQNLANVNSQITALLIVALGQLLVALTAGIDLSVGSVLSLTSALLVSVDPSIAVPVAVLAGIAVGLANGTGVAIFGVHPLIMTLASMTFLQGLTFLIHPVPGGEVPGFLLSMVRFTAGGFPAALYWCAATVLTAILILHRTRFGLRVFAVGANQESVALNGVSVNPLKIACYVLCSLAGVLAGIFLTARVASGDPTIGASFGLDSVTAVALGGVQLSGGIGSVIGAIFGTITLGLMANGMNLLGVSPFIRAAVTGGLLLAAISLQRRKVIGV
jgi:ribose/xylose/arabinose/galactoside ABC-type transport system permease subunit